MQKKIENAACSASDANVQALKMHPMASKLTKISKFDSKRTTVLHIFTSTSRCYLRICKLL